MPLCENLRRHHFGDKSAALLRGLSFWHVAGSTDEIYTFRRTCVGCLLVMLCNDREPRRVNVFNSDAGFKIFCLGQHLTPRRCRLQSSMRSFSRTLVANPHFGQHRR